MGNLCTSVDDQFQYACFVGDVQTAKRLLKHPKIDPRDYDGVCLWSAIMSNKHDIVKLLLQDGRIDPSAKDSEILNRAINWQKNEQILQALLDDGRVSVSDEVIKRAYGFYYYADFSDDDVGERTIAKQKCRVIYDLLVAYRTSKQPDFDATKLLEFYLRHKSITTQKAEQRCEERKRAEERTEYCSRNMIVEL